MYRSDKLSATTSAGLSLWTVVQITRSELRCLLRLFRFRLVSILLSAAMLGAYILSCLVSVNIAPFNFSFVSGTPLYLLENLDSAYFLLFQAGLLLLIFDWRHRNRNDRMEEVLESRRVTNLEFVLGCSLCYSGVIWVIIFLNVLLMQLIGLGSQIFQIDIANTIQLHSLFNLLVVDTPVALLFWTSLFIMLTNLIRSRVLVLLTGFATTLVYYLCVLNTPFVFVDLLSHSSNQTLFISDIFPALPSTISWVMRAGTLLIVFVLLSIGAEWFRRTDSSPKLWTRLVPMASLCFGVLVLSAGVLYKLVESHEFNNWRKAHLTYEWNAKLDIQAIQGEVEINPHQRLHIDLNLDFNLASTVPVQTLVFTLNPGYKVSSVRLNETQCEFEFKYGILEIAAPFAVEPKSEYSLKIVAIGKPDPRFAYLNTPYDYLKDANFPIQAVRSFGTDGSIFNSKFVALMPGAHWYPIPGHVPYPVDDDSLRSDFFTVELLVELKAAPNWTVVGPGTTRTNLEKANQFLVQPKIPIASIGLFASDFVEFAHDFQDIRLSLHVHKQHANNFLPLEQYKDGLLEWIEEGFADIRELGTTHPFQTISFVEVPNKLRIVSGGWQMDRLNSLPGLVLIKERGLPTINIDYLMKVVEKQTSGRDEYSNYIWSTLFDSSLNALGNENIVSAVHDQYWKHVIWASSEHSKALNLIYRSLSESLTLFGSDGLFSVYATSQAARATGLNIPAALGTDRGRDRGVRVFDKKRLYLYEWTYANRSAIRDVMEHTALPDLKFQSENHQRDFEVLYLKSELIAQAIDEFLRFQGDLDSIDRWLLALRREFLGKPHTYKDAMSLAHDFDINVDLFIADWLAKDTLAGFEAGTGVSTRIADSEDGKPRFLFSFDITNTQPTAGFVRVPIYLRSNPTIVLDGDTSKRVTILLDRGLDYGTGLNLSLYTGLSLNRGPLGFLISTMNVPTDETLVPRSVVEESNFVPHLSGIVVDDLDDGFIVHQPKPVSMQFQLTPRDWIGVSTIGHLFDGVLPDIGEAEIVPRSTWVRRTEKNAYGKYRHTVALSKVSGSLKLHPVRFVADIPESGLWSLDYYLHFPSNPMQYGNIEGFNLRIENGSKHWKEEFYPNPLDLRWKPVGEYRLESGRTDVVVVGATKPSIVYADAIRWRKKDVLE